MAKPAGTSLVKYAEYDDNEAAEDAKEAASGSGGKVLKFKVGKTTMRPVPSLPGKRLKLMTHQHAVDVPGVGTVFLNCAKLMRKQECAVCKVEAKLMATKNSKDEARARKLRARPRFYMNVIVRGEEELGVRVAVFGKQINDQLVEIRQDVDEGGNYAHPVTGFDLIVRRKGTGQNDTEYTVTASKTRPKVLHEDATVMNEWIEGQNDLERYARVFTLSQQEAKLRGEDIDDEEDDEEKKPTKRASKSVDEDVDDGVLVADDDDDED